MSDIIQAGAQVGTGPPFAGYREAGTGNYFAGAALAYITGGVPEAYTFQQIDATHGLPVSVLGSLPLPSGAATAANQATANTALAAIAAYLAGTLGVAGTVAVSNFPSSFNVGNFPSSQAVTGTFWQATQPVSIGASVAVTGIFFQATQPVSIADGSNTTQGAKADARATDSTSSWSVVALLKGLYALFAAGLGRTWALASGTDSVTTVPSGTQAVSGTFYQATQPVSAASLPLPAGASTAAKQPALGTAGAASADVITVQGVASMTALKVDGSGVTQPVSLAALPALTAGSAKIGVVTTDQTTPGTTDLIHAAQQGTWNVATVTTVSVVTAITNALPAGSNVIGVVGSPDGVVSVNPTISTSVYVSGYSVGGIQTIAGATRVSGGTTLLESVTVVDASGQKAPLSLFFFSASPAGTYTDHGAVTVNSADWATFLGKIDVAAADYDTIGTGAVATEKGLGLLLKPGTGTSLYCVAVTSGTPTYAALALTFVYGFLQS